MTPVIDKVAREAAIDRVTSGTYTQASELVDDLLEAYFSALPPSPCQHVFEGRYDKPDDGIKLMQWYCRKCGMHQDRAEQLAKQLPPSPATPVGELEELKACIQGLLDAYPPDNFVAAICKARWRAARAIAASPAPPKE